MNLKIIKNNKELLNIFKNYELKSNSSLEERKDLDVIAELKDKLKIKKMLKHRGGRCFLNYKKGDMKIILPIEKEPYFRIVHINIKNGKNSNILNKVINLVNYWKGSSTIVFLGVDGSGKTTIAKKIFKTLSPFFRVHLRYFGWNQFFIPIFNITKRISKKNKPKISKEKVSWFYLLVFYFELLIRYYLNILPKKILGRTIIIDRYFYDKLVHLKASSFKFKFFNTITPKPDLSILLIDHPERIHKRKKEREISEIKILQKLYLNKIHTFNIIIIKNDKTIPHAIKRVIYAIRKMLINKKRVLE